MKQIQRQLNIQENQGSAKNFENQNRDGIHIFSTRLAIFLGLACFASYSRAADEFLLSLPGKVIFESKLDSAIGAPWKVLKGNWQSTNEVFRGGEKTEDLHAGVLRLTNVLGDFVVDYEIKFAGASYSAFSINQGQGILPHLGRILIRTNEVVVQRDLAATNPDHTVKGIVFGHFPARFEPGAWHKVHVEMVGDTLLGQVDNLTAWGRDDFFKQARTVGFTVRGEAIEVRNFRLTEATLNPEWNRVQKGIKSAGEKTVKAKPEPKTE